MKNYTLLIHDTHANFSFGRALDGDIDLARLREEFKPDPDTSTYHAVYVMQRSERLTDAGYNSFISTVEHRLHWEIDTCVPDYSPSRSNAIMVETMQTSMIILERLEDWCTHKTDDGEYISINLILCLHHPTYVITLTKIKQLYPYAHITLVCAEHTAQTLKNLADHVVDIRELNIVRVPAEATE